MVYWTIIISFLTTVFLGIPIAFCMGISSLIFLIVCKNVPLNVIPQRFFGSINSFVLLAIPFFILAGELMNKTGITKKLVVFANLLVGNLRGGLAQVNILSSILFAGMTGAGVSDTASLGSILIPAMVDDGFEPAYSAAVTASSSVIGPIIPPSIIMVVFGSVMSLSITNLFMAGFIPGLIIGLSLMVMVYITAKKQNQSHVREGGRCSLKELLTGLKEAIIPLLMPIIIITGMFSGYFTPTEAAAIAVAYALIVGLVLRTLKISDLIECLIKSAVTTSVVLLIIGMANVFGWVLAIEKIPQMFTNFLISMNLSRISFLIITNFFLLFMGMIMETGANVVLLAPILMPIAIKFGIDPLHFALIMIINLNIGLATPPLGVCLFVACPIAKINMEQITKAISPFIFMEVIALFLITFIPDLVLFIPKLFGY